jgi:hypothetical protein
VLLALLLVLFSQPDNLSKDLRIEAVALGFLIDFPVAFVELADFLLDVSKLVADKSRRQRNSGILLQRYPLGPGASGPSVPNFNFCPRH